MPASTKLFIGDVVRVLPNIESNSIDLCMTSPPYWGLRDYGVSGQIGLEKSFEEYGERIAGICTQIMRVLKPSGSFYLNLGDTYVGSNMGLKDYRLHKSLQDPAANPQYPQSLTKSLQTQVKRVRNKSLVGIPWRVALRLIDDGWILRSDIIWHKPNHMPASVKDRLSNSYEHLFHFVKSERYYYDLDAIRVPHKDASVQRMMKAIEQGLKPKETKYTDAIPNRKQVQGGRYFVPNWAKEYYRQGEFATGQDKRKPPRKMELLHDITHGRINHGMYAGGVFKGILQNPMGKNPGDVVSYERPVRPSDILRDAQVNRTGGVIYRPGRPPLQNNPLGKNPSDFWSITTRSFRGAHFAVYPESLCVRPIISSSPEKVCSKCGSPARKVSKGFSANPFNIRYRDGKSGRLEKKWGDMVTAPHEATEIYDEQNYEVRSATRIVWPGCSCNAKFALATILDPFAGSCTTLKVARDCGRNSIGIEINPDYVEVARQRFGIGIGDHGLEVIRCK